MPSRSFCHVYFLNRVVERRIGLSKALVYSFGEEIKKALLPWFLINLYSAKFVFVPPSLLISSNTPEILKEFGYKYYFYGFNLKISKTGIV